MSRVLPVPVPKAVPQVDMREFAPVGGRGYHVASGTACGAAAIRMRASEATR